MPATPTVKEAAGRWLEAAKRGEARNRSGRRYKPSALRGYEASLALHVLPSFGARRLDDLRLSEVQEFADRLTGDNDPSTVRNAIGPLRVIYRHARLRGMITINPTTGLQLPAVEGGRDRVASPAEAERLLAALPEGDRAVWATALYAGLRRGELLALDYAALDFDRSLICIERAWDRKEGLIDLKSRAGRRRVPMIAELRQLLLGAPTASGRSSGLVFGRTSSKPFDPSTLSGRAQRTWAKAELEPISLHECRHTFASFMIAAGVNAKAISTYLGHSSISVTFDKYGHLFPGNEQEAAELLSEYLSR
jgi:integrase